MYSLYMANAENYCADCGQSFDPTSTGEDCLQEEFCYGKVCRYWLIDQSRFDEREEADNEEK